MADLSDFLTFSDLSDLSDDDAQYSEPPYPRHDAPRNLIQNASIATYHAEPPATGKFTLFPNLPVELRIKIWHHAISVPRIVEMEKTPCWQHESTTSATIGLPEKPDRWQYRIKNPPPLLCTCAESRREALGVHTNENNVEELTSNPPWIRYDYDILHLKVRRWNEQNQYIPHMWAEYDNLEGDGSMSAKRQCFARIEALAVKRELFLGTDDWQDRADIVVQSFFPKLKLLIILIDDKLDLDVTQDPTDYVVFDYEESKNSRGRRGCITASASPFTPVSYHNVYYQSYIEEELDSQFEWAKPYSEGYLAPHVVVMECAHSSRPKIPGCGHRPVEDKDLPDLSNLFLEPNAAPCGLGASPNKKPDDDETSASG
jgi:hypothetical protein